ncbi:hypothetical protein VC273_16195 [Xanthomonas nasturtii]|uniref:hypothetical protein n=1 Tax=Xanthomonas TaxID=338 RepID=UPI002B23C95E|nr:hypothetical protein [Xanthomonas nasturtii]MEA9557395.1 hypothetical protein [Xanthomonas nasturtii]
MDRSIDALPSIINIVISGSIQRPHSQQTAKSTLATNARRPRCARRSLRNRTWHSMPRLGRR